MRDLAVMIGIGLLVYANKAIAARHVNPFVSRIEGHVIGAIDCRKRCDGFTSLRVEDYEPCWFAGYDKEAMIFFIERHGNVIGGVGDLPRLEQLAAFLIKNTYLALGAHISEHPCPIVLKGDCFYPSAVDTDLVHLLRRN